MTVMDRRTLLEYSALGLIGVTAGCTNEPEDSSDPELEAHASGLVDRVDEFTAAVQTGHAEFDKENYDQSIDEFTAARDIARDGQSDATDALAYAEDIGDQDAIDAFDRSRQFFEEGEVAMDKLVQASEAGKHGNVPQVDAHLAEAEETMTVVEDEVRLDLLAIQSKAR